MAISKRTWETPEGERRSAWEAAYSDQQGKRRRKQFARKRDAEAWLVNARSEVASGIHTPDSQSITVADAAVLWLQACQRGRDGREPVEPHTLRSYESHVRLHINPLVGAELLSGMTTPKVNAFRDSLVDTTSRAMAKKVLVSLKAMITEAQSRGLVAQNVAKSVKITTAGRHKAQVEIPTREQVRAIIEKAKEQTNDRQPHIARAWRRYYPLLLMSAMTGMRASEIRGLYWSSIDLKNGAISVCQRADENCLIGPVKSKDSRRRITIPPSLSRALREWRLLCPPGELVFPNWQGNVERHANIVNRCWYQVCERCGLATVTHAAKKKRVSPVFNFHALRHFHASMLIASGASPKEVQVEMGHSSVQVTFDIYGHLFPEDEGLRVQRAATMESEIFG
jgi:integrase